MAEYAWQDKKGYYTNGEDLTLNGFIIGEYFYDPFVSKGSHLAYAITTRLPVFRPKITHFKTSDEAKESLIKFTQRWFERMK